MSKITTCDKRTERKGWLRRNYVSVLTLLIIITISVSLFFYGRNPERVLELEKYRYLGAFLISLIGNAAVLLPGIVLPILAALGVDFYQAGGGLAGPIIIGLVGGVGAAIGEIVAYMAGYSGRGVIERSRLYKRLANWVMKWGAVAIFVLSLVPLFFDVVGIAAGILRFPLWRFILVCWLGRTILYVSIVVAVALGWETVFPYPG
jgi:membrane protein YqaA with SNARE-associated domain